MKFRGDIIITDPCYIIKSEEKRAEELGITIPEYPVHVVGENMDEYQDKVEKWRKFDVQLNDWSRCGYGENMEVLGLTTYISESTLYGDWSCTTWSTPRKDVEAQLEEVNTLCREQYELVKKYGVDSVQAKIYDDKIADATLDLKDVGHFCADAGMVAVFLLDEVLKYNPDFNYHTNREWTTTLIKDFDGDVEYHIDEDGNAHIIGKGNINFFTTQTGL